MARCGGRLEVKILHLGYEAPPSILLLDVLKKNNISGEAGHRVFRAVVVKVNVKFGVLQKKKKKTFRCSPL